MVLFLAVIALLETTRLDDEELSVEKAS